VFDSTTEICDQNPDFIVMATNIIIIIPKICSLLVVNWQSHLNCAMKDFYLFESQSLETVVHVNWCSILFNKCDSGLFLKCDWVSCNTVNW